MGETSVRESNRFLFLLLDPQGREEYRGRPKNRERDREKERKKRERPKNNPKKEELGRRMSSGAESEERGDGKDPLLSPEANKEEEQQQQQHHHHHQQQQQEQQQQQQQQLRRLCAKTPAGMVYLSGEVNNFSKVYISTAYVQLFPTCCA